MSYIRHDINNDSTDPQPSSTEVTIFDGTEGWTDITYKDWNVDYVARNVDNTVRIPDTYQARTADNTPRTPVDYQRHDVNNDPVEI
jgi:hypothetical protein